MDGQPEDLGEVSVGEADIDQELGSDAGSKEEAVTSPEAVVVLKNIDPADVVVQQNTGNDTPNRTSPMRWLSNDDV